MPAVCSDVGTSSRGAQRQQQQQQQQRQRAAALRENSARWRRRAGRPLSRPTVKMVGFSIGHTTISRIRSFAVCSPAMSSQEMPPLASMTSLQTF
jgi:hypothetical protein